MPDFEKAIQFLQTILAGSDLRKVAEQHLNLLRAQVSQAQQRQAQAEAKTHELEAQCNALQHSLEECCLQLQRFAKDNPLAHRCDQCGSVDLHLTGQQLAIMGGEFGLREGVYQCRVCNHTSIHAMAAPS